MIIDGRGAVLEGASLTLTPGSQLYNMTLIRCDIDDTAAAHPFAEQCQFIDCKFRTQWEAGRNLE